ncbi:hypothetical protein [Planococcus sp. CAU13]|uniref:hypothetical protein n=1 Tax=Planococcus sp. CAU13 TaxID=1541197 RepID=UPI00052FFB69|nr:hypothetical protein [Planococcus sp. CAU13]
MDITFKDGKRTLTVAEDDLRVVPVIGDVITDTASGGETYLVKSVIHHTVFHSPDKSEAIIVLELQ